jgi:hypothetical protein
MKILRDESGHVLVLRALDILEGGKTAVKEQSLSKPIVMKSTQSVSCAVPHCCFICAWCGEPILLPNDSIGSPFGNPAARKIDVRSIATVCHGCKHISTYSMFRMCRGFDTRHKIVHAPKQGETVLLTWLQCAESTCPDRAPLFAKLDGDDGAEETRVAAWLWNELTCASGHRIKPVPLDPTIQLPVRSFAGRR